ARTNRPVVFDPNRSVSDSVPSERAIPSRAISRAKTTYIYDPWIASPVRERRRATGLSPIEPSRKSSLEPASRAPGPAEAPAETPGVALATGARAAFAGRAGGVSRLERHPSVSASRKASVRTRRREPNRRAMLRSYATGGGQRSTHACGVNG